MTLFLNNDFSGRGETFFADDNFLKDNKIGADTVSSIKVQPNTNPPTSPVPIWPEDNTNFSRDTSLSLVWEDTGGASEYLIDFPGITQTWQIGSVYPLGSLASGTYIWKVKARNSNGESAWSDSQTLIIDDGSSDTASPITAPFSDGMENGYNGWNPSSNWDQALDEDLVHPGELIWRYEVNSASSGYDNDIPNTGDLTSPAIVIPDDGNKYDLRFWYLYETEGAWEYWDQRWVQLSVDGEPFTNLVQLKDDPPDYWLESPAISLANYAGSTIRVRFHFETLDAALNDFKGWYIDDFSITTTPPPTCSETGEPNDSPQQAQVTGYNSIVNAEICPGGDMDFYKFDGIAGDQIGITTVAQSVGSNLDTYIYLLDSNGSVLTENDDIILYELRDSSLSFILPNTDTYYIKVRAWNHPSAGGDDHTYSLHLANDSNDPTAEISTPQDYTFLSRGEEKITVNANDEGSGISHVDFFWHSGDWQFGSWEYISSDWESDDGWSTDFDTRQ
ncbi:MAG: PPC domain-containing protein, partial [Anaerolineales bacterium]|nr:PPC domain-containing protein [Anaerolineales bacterium]